MTRHAMDVGSLRWTFAEVAGGVSKAAVAVVKGAHGQTLAGEPDLAQSPGRNERRESRLGWCVMSGRRLDCLLKWV